MPFQPGVFVLRGKTLLPMAPAQFDAEVVFQQQLADFPELLSGDQIDPDNPRRFILVKQEQAIGHGSDPVRWSVDHLFLDQEGIPTLVEVKRKNDTRLRREVVAQMLDYAANYRESLTSEGMRSDFEATCAARGKPQDSILGDLIGPDQSAETFWASVNDNLQAGKLRLLFVADMIPSELRTIVEFLNDQMRTVEILAIELRQFASEDLRTIVPLVFGQTPIAARKHAGSITGSAWTSERLLSRFDANLKPPAASAARAIFVWMEASGRPLRFGKGAVDGSVMFLLKPQGIPINPAYLSTAGQLWLQLGPLPNKPVFGDVDRRCELVKRFGAVNASALSDVKTEKDQSLSFDVIAADPAGVDKVIAALKWMVEQAEEDVPSTAARTS